MKLRLPPFLRQGDPEATADPKPRSASGSTTLELLVVEGPDAGSQFTVDGETIRVGRGELSEKGRTGAICLRDSTVSPNQATLHVSELGVEMAHRQGATNATFVNGKPFDRIRLQVGDRIRMGNTVLGLRSRPGISLSGLFAIPKSGPTTEVVPVAADVITTEVRREPPREAELVLLRGIEGQEGQRFPLLSCENRLGRNPDNDVVLLERGVSRQHAEIVWEGEHCIFVHRSATNPSYVEGHPVDERAELRDGQEIQLADRVVLRIEFAPAPAARPAPAGDAGAEASTLQQRMEEKIRRDEELEREYGFNGSFLDIDVVDSLGLKVNAQRPEHIIVSFERFRAFARSVVEEHEGNVLNSNGDELMCFFEEPYDAVCAAADLCERLRDFNAEQNLLGAPFRVRQGIHTGRTLLDRQRGVAYSPVLDVAGHLQKEAPPGGMLVSEETLSRLPGGLAFRPVGAVGREKVAAHCWDPAVDEPLPREKRRLAAPPGEE